jgi:hypothetical protein
VVSADGIIISNLHKALPIRHHFMKTLIAIICLLISVGALSQDDSNFISSSNYFKANRLALNVIEPPKGFNLFYNCDSMLFVRGDFSDTIKIWTPGTEWAHTLAQFKEIMSKSEYGKTVFAKSIMSDGRILVVNSMETLFIFRNDSLYQIEDTVSKPKEYYSMLVDHMLGRMDEKTYKHRKDSIDVLYRDRHAYVPKLIFSKNMFGQGKRKVRLSAKVNYEKDEIELEREWVENGKKCYLVRINNRFEKEKTSYAYAINEDIKFIWWEGCSNRTQN